MPKTSASLANKPRQYSDFLKGIKLVIVALDHASSAINREQYWKCTEKKNGMARTFEASYAATEIDGTCFDVVGRLEMKILSTSDNSELLKIVCQYSSHFHARTRVDERAAHRFANAEAKIIIWPYFRQLVTDLSARMYIPPIIVPLSLDAK
jgi:preprotein translocase subunit SecB